MKVLMRSSVLLVLSVLVLVRAPDAHALMGTDFALDASLSWGLGSVHNASSSVAGRTVNALAITAFPGYKFSGFMVGPIAEYRRIGQNSDPASVGNTNVKGNSWLLGLGVEYEILMFTFTAAYDFLGSYSLSNNTSSGQSTSYKKPSGLLLKAGYYFIPMISFDVSFSAVSYGTNTLGGADTDISGNKLTETNYAIGATGHF